MRAVLVLLAALTAAAVPAAAGEDPAPTYDDTASTVRFINAAPGTPDLRVRIDDEDVTRAFGDAGPFARVRSGPHQVALASGGVVDTETFSFAAATAYDLVAAFERDPGGGSRPHLALHAVPLDRVTSGLAGVRFVSANGTLGTVVLSISSAGGTTALTAPPRTSSVRVGVPAGPVRFTVGASDHDEIYRALAAVLEPDAFVSVVWIAGGEESARLVVVGDGAQPHERPIPGLAVNTGLPPGGSARLLASAAPAVALAFALAATATTSALRTWRRRDLAAALAAVLLLAACSAALPPTAAPSDAAASPGRAALSGTSVAPIPATAAATAIIATTATGTAPPVRVLASAVGIDAGIVPVDPAILPSLYPALGPAEVGRLGATGGPGLAHVEVLVGHHSETTHEPPAFGHLAELRVGDEVRLVDALGRDVGYEVRSSSVVPIDALPDALFDARVEPTIILITCEGTWMPARGLAPFNRVVVATARR